MGKEWDSDKGGRKEWIAWMTEVMRECLRVMKPGAHGLVWALPRTSHWTATALEDAGFEIRDVVMHLFGSGFPKSYNIGQAIEKRLTIGSDRRPDRNLGKGRVEGFPDNHGFQNLDTGGQIELTTDLAKQWSGFGTALKPACEHWILIRKPCSEKTVAANVLKWGTGALNIDGTRIPIDANEPNSRPNGSIPLSEGGKTSMFKLGGRNPECDGNTLNLAKGRFPSHLILDVDGTRIPIGPEGHPQGRFPSHLILDEDAAKMLDEQSLAGGMHGAGKLSAGTPMKCQDMGIQGEAKRVRLNTVRLGDSGGASRFFYCPKVSPSERNAGCEDIGNKRRSDARPNSGDLTGKFPDHDHRVRSGNHHPTVKPQKLMRYLCRLVTPPGGTVLDPFTGSGSTGCAATSEGFGFCGIEKEPEYFDIAKARIAHQTNSADLGLSTNC